MAYRYRREVLEELERRGIRPTPETDPRKLYDFLKALYSFEIRKLRGQRKKLETALGPLPLDGYRRRLHALKDRYPLLAMPGPTWLETRGTGPGSGSGSEGADQGAGERAE